MLKQVRLTLKAENGQKPNIFWAYNLYGMLMEKIDQQYAEYLHGMNIKPISQYLTSKRDEEEICWTVNLMGEEASRYFLDVLFNSDSFTVENHDTRLQVLNCEIVKEISEKEIVQKYLAEDAFDTSLTVSTEVPCSFKSNEMYAFFPSESLIINSAIQKWNAYASETFIDDEEAVEQIIRAVRIFSYRLKSFQYHVKGARIPSFSGDVTLSIRGPEPMVRLFNLLMHFLEFSGLGIKSALGMGGVKIIKGGKSNG